MLTSTLGRGWLAQQLRQAASERINHINDHIGDLGRFGDLTEGYWGRRYDDDGLQKEAELKIKSAFIPISYYYGDQPSIVNKEMYLKLLSCAMGGNFETCGRDADCARALEVRSISWTIIHDARKHRRELARISKVLSSSWKDAI